jgi:hypothetical protein
MKTRSKKCRNCKEEFTPYTSLQKFCTKSECIRVFVDETKAKKWAKDKREKKAELMTVTDWVKIAQTAFNTYIRERDKSLGNPCFSCRKPLPSKFDAGHFMNANNHWSVRFDERNVHAQCVHCNQHLHGNLLEYRNQLEFYFGSAWLAQLERDAKETRKFTIEELKEITSTYKQKLKDLKNNCE